MNKAKQVFYVRKFLNPPKVNAGAYILASIEKYFNKGRINKRNGKRYRDTVDRDITLTIADCSRLINLEFNFYTKKQAKEYLKKLDVLVDTLIKFRENYKKEVEEYLKEDTSKIYV